MGVIKTNQLDGDYSNPRATPGVIDRERPINVQSASGREAGKNGVNQSPWLRPKQNGVFESVIAA